MTFGISCLRVSTRLGRRACPHAGNSHDGAHVVSLEIPSKPPVGLATGAHPVYYGRQSHPLSAAGIRHTEMTGKWSR
jgi:hypothetical protein